MATTRRRRRTTVARRPARASLTSQAINWGIAQAGATWHEMSDDARRDVVGILVLGPFALGIVASMVFPAPWLAWLRGVTLWLVGFGWPLLAGGLGVGSVLLVHPVAAKGLQRYQGVAAALAAWAFLALLSLRWAPAGGVLGAGPAARLSHGLGGGGATIVLVLILGLGAVFAARLRIVQVVGHALRPRELVRVVRASVAGTEPAKAGAVAAPAPAAATPTAAPIPTPEKPPAPAGAAESRGEPADEDPEPAEEEAPEVDRPRMLATRNRRWTLPAIDVLAAPRARTLRQRADVQATVAKIESKLRTFKIAARVIEVNHGSSITQYVIEIPEDVPVSEVVKRQQDLSLALAASPLRIQAPIPGRSAIGLEVPNKAREIATLREVLESEGTAPEARYLPLGLGTDVAGKPVLADLASMPHLLVAGATGQGKSVFVNVLIGSLLLQHPPETLRLLLIDPKRVELSGYSGLPHLAAPVIEEPAQAVQALRWAVAEMERRYREVKRLKVRNIAVYNELRAAAGEAPMAYLAILVDELADLMMVSRAQAIAEKRAGSEVEDQLVRLAQMARAVGIHLVLATQRPSTDVLTGLLKANVPARIAFKVASGTDSRVILDANGAEKLLGKGDMLYQPVDGEQIRLQGAFLGDREIEAVVEGWTRQLHGQPPEYLLRLDDPEPVEASA